MAKLKNLSLLTVLTVSVKTPTLDLIHKGTMQKTNGNPLLAAIPVNDTAMAADVSGLQTAYNGFKAVPPTVTEATVSSKKITVVTAYNQNAGYIQGVARSQAIAAGDINVGINIVKESGYELKKTKSPSKRLFKVTNAGPGAVDITTKAVATKAGYIRQYGPTTSKTVPPTVFQELLFTLEVEAHVNNLKSGTIYGFREATILPIKHATTGGTPTTEVLKAATPTSATKGHKAIFTDGVTSHYVWSEWVYIVIT
jgi:hypothetical protein